MLDIWPPLPIVIRASGYETWEGVDNIVAALKHNDRINAIDICDIPTSQLGDILEETQRPFPALTRLGLRSHWPAVVDCPDSFLGGFAPCLQALTMEYISFSGLQNLLLSATHLVHLVLQGITFSGFLSPDEMVTSISVLTRLDELVIEFDSLRCPKSQRPPPQTRTLLPVLTKLGFKGFNEYLEDLVARIDAPLLDNLEITFFYQQNFNTSQLTQLISRTPKFRTHDEAHVVFSDKDISVTLPQTSDGALKLGILCRPSNWELWGLAQVCGSSFPLIPAVEYLYIIDGGIWGAFPDSQDNTEWLEFFHPFTAVKDLYILSAFMPCIAPALQELGVTGMFPALRTLYLEDPTDFQEATAQFVTARQLAGHPIAISRWEREIEDS
jgi:hypothetical protein